MAHHTCINLLRTYDHDDESALVSYFPLTFNRFPGTRTRRQQQLQRIRQHHGRGGEERNQQGQKLGERRWRRRRRAFPDLGVADEDGPPRGGRGLSDVRFAVRRPTRACSDSVQQDLWYQGRHRRARDPLFTTFHRETYRIRRSDAPTEHSLVDRVQRLADGQP